jgi:actin-related protein
MSGKCLTSGKRMATNHFYVLILCISSNLSYDLELDTKLGNETTVLVEEYELPDGRVIKVGSERFEAPECMFQPHLVDVEAPGVAGKFAFFSGRKRVHFSTPAHFIQLCKSIYQYVLV